MTMVLKRITRQLPLFSKMVLYAGALLTPLLVLRYYHVVQSSELKGPHLTLFDSFLRGARDGPDIRTTFFPYPSIQRDGGLVRRLACWSRISKPCSQPWACVSMASAFSLYPSLPERLYNPRPTDVGQEQRQFEDC